MKFQNTPNPNEKEFIKEYIEYVEEDLMQIYKLPIAEVERLLKGSAFMELIRKDPKFVLHYDPMYWAKEIMNTRKGIFQYH